MPLRVGVNVRKADLAIGLTEEDELNSKEKVLLSAMKELTFTPYSAFCDCMCS